MIGFFGHLKEYVTWTLNRTRAMFDERRAPYQTFGNCDEFGMTTLLEGWYDAHDRVADVQTVADVHSFGYDLPAKVSSQRQRELDGFVNGQLLRLSDGAQQHLTVALWKKKKIKKNRAFQKPRDGRRTGRTAYRPWGRPAGWPRTPGRGPTRLWRRPARDTWRCWSTPGRPRCRTSALATRSFWTTPRSGRQSRRLRRLRRWRRRRRWTFDGRHRRETRSSTARPTTGATPNGLISTWSRGPYFNHRTSGLPLNHRAPLSVRYQNHLGDK